MLIFDKQEIRDFLSEDNMMDLLQEFGGDPERTKFGIICTTICHNPPGDGSRKLYWYSNTGLFRCYTGCDEPIFDIFELVIKVMNIQHHINMDLNEAVRWVASKFGFVGRNKEIDPEDRLDDWTFLANYDRIQDIKEKSNHVILKEYNITKTKIIIISISSIVSFLNNFILFFISSNPTYIKNPTIPPTKLSIISSISNTLPM